MKKLYFIILFPLIHVNAQQYYDTVNYNSINALVSNYGTHFQDFDLNIGRFEVPTGSGMHFFDGMKFVFAGKDLNNQLYMSQGGDPGLGRDLFPGPFSTTGNYPTPEYRSIYSLCQSEIDQYRLFWACSEGLIVDGCDTLTPISNEVVEKIYSWPTYGDISMGQAYFLAPFYDYDHDGVYNPENGDYPLIKGCCETLLIQNDAKGPHTFSGTEAMGIEVQTRFSVYSDINYLDSTLFVEVLAINRGIKSYPEFILSMFLDPKVGDYQDDYFGCDSTNNMLFFYNNDNNDNTFGLNPPAMAVYSLEENLSSVVSNEAIPLNSLEDTYNLLKGLHSDGSPWINPSMNSTNFVFNGNPNTGSGWNQNGNIPDKRVYASINCGAFNPTDTVKQTFAISYASGGTNVQNIQKLFDLSSTIKNFYENEAETFCYDTTLKLEENEFFASIFPNPSTGVFTIQTESSGAIKLKVYNLQGTTILEENVVKSKYSFQLREQGVYLVEIQTPMGTSTKKVIVN